jgi:hypothetical protein
MYVQGGKAESDHGADAPMHPLNSGSTDLHSPVIFVVDVNKGRLSASVHQRQRMVRYGLRPELRP